MAEATPAVEIGSKDVRRLRLYNLLIGFVQIQSLPQIGDPDGVDGHTYRYADHRSHGYANGYSKAHRNVDHGCGHCNAHTAWRMRRHQHGESRGFAADYPHRPRAGAGNHPASPVRVGG